MRTESLLLTAGLLFFSAAGHCGAEQKKDVPGIIDAALAKMAGIKLMEPEQVYTVAVAGAKETGPKEFFIGLRTGAEVLESRAASGCSDYAAAFYKLMQDAGLKPVFIMGTTMSFTAMLDNFNDHTGVAVKNGAKWILVDPTKGIVVSRNWDYNSRVYEDEYYIGYKGSLEAFAFKGPVGCKEFNRRNVLKMPPELLNGRIPYLDVYADDTMKNPAGKENIQVRLVREQLAGFYKSHGLKPTQKVKLRLTRSTEPFTTDANCYVRECVMALGEKTMGYLGNLAWAVESVSAVAALREKKDELVRFEYTVDASMKNPDGTYANPYLEAFLKDAGELYDALDIDKGRTVKVLIVNAGDNANSGLSFEPGRGWVLAAGARSAMSLSLHQYLQDVYPKMKSAANKT